jgi:hypothetical protein
MKDQSLLSRLEKQALEEGREWTRKRLETLITDLADEQGEVSPPEPERVDPKTKDHGDAAHPRRDNPDS